MRDDYIYIIVKPEQSCKSRRQAVTGNSDVRSIHCFDSRNDIDTTNSKYICDISTLKRQVTKYCNTQVVKSVAIDTAFIFREYNLLVVTLSIVPLFLVLN